MSLKKEKEIITLSLCIWLKYTNSVREKKFKDFSLVESFLVVSTWINNVHINSVDRPVDDCQLNYVNNNFE